MDKADISSEDYRNLLSQIIPIIYRNGLKATTMDSVAAALGMSKRTIYEIFDSKNNLLCEIFEEMGRQHKDLVRRIFDAHPNVLEAFIALSIYHRDNLNRVNISFFRDLDTLYQQVRGNYNDLRRQRTNFILPYFEQGIRQGILRKDINYRALEEMRMLQMIAIKNSDLSSLERETSLTELFDCMSIAFLRSIVVPEHIADLDRMMAEKGLLGSSLHHYEG